jgi:hypothetical protein
MPNNYRPTTGEYKVDPLTRSRQTPREPWLATGSFNLVGGGYVQWTRVAGADTEMLVEINEGGDYEEPMPVDLVARLVAMGWEEPDDQFRNCWAMAHPADVDRFEQLARLALDGAEFIDAWRRPRSSLALSADGLALTTGGRSVRETADGGLLIEGHDLGDAVSRFWGDGLTEYEFARRLDPGGVAELRRMAGLGDAPLLRAIRDRFASTAELERFLKGHGIESTFWSRVGN